MSAWVGIGISVFMAVLTAGIAVGLIRARMDSMVQGQAHLETALTAGQLRLEGGLSDLARAVALLTTSSAVNAAEHAELSRRILALETKQPEILETLSTLRTRSHMHASKLQELDPAWKPYQET
jgi:hypothetical protein